MEYKIWSHFIQILSYRKDLIGTIKPFFDNLINNNINERYNINDENHIPFLQSLSKSDSELLSYFKIINAKQDTENSSDEDANSYQEKVKKIIQNNQLEELQKFIQGKDIKTISPISKSFNEIEKMAIPIIHYCVIEKAVKCFKFLLINGIDDPTVTMNEQNPNPSDYLWSSQHQYEWDCMALAIYYGVWEIVDILEEKGIEKGKKPGHIEAAILSYRNSFANELISQLKEAEEINKTMKNEILMLSLIASAKNNNIKGGEILVNNGAPIDYKNDEIPLLTPLAVLKKETPLHTAVKYNSKEMFELLLLKEADFKACTIQHQNINTCVLLR